MAFSRLILFLAPEIRRSCRLQRCRLGNMDNNSAYWQTFLEHAELSDVGLRRANNQDSMACMLAGNEGDFFRRGHLFVVADGMGRHAAGELASKILVDT